MPLTGGGTAGLSMLAQRLSKIPGYQPQMIGEALPTVRKLLSGATSGSSAAEGPSAPGTVPPARVGWAGRRYQVSPEMQARIDANTVVQVEGRSIAVTLGTANVHLRAVVPMGELPLKWRGAIAARINGAIRRHLKGGQAYGPIERVGAKYGRPMYGPREQRKKYGPKLPPMYGPRQER